MRYCPDLTDQPPSIRDPARRLIMAPGRSNREAELSRLPTEHRSTITQLAVYDWAVAICKTRDRERRISALHEVPESLKNDVAAEAERIWKQRSG